MKKIIWLILIILLITLGYFGWEKYSKQNYFPKKESVTIENPPSADTNTNQAVDDFLVPGNTTENSLEGKNVPGFIEIKREDCENECQNFTVEKEIKYCREVCGLNPPKPENGCDSLSGLEKDYCLKDSAVRKKDYKICDEINDQKIKQTCQNRVTEEILEQ